jgi:hypothetical protein
VILNDRASFDGWRILAGGELATERDRWRVAPVADEGLLVAGLTDDGVAELPACRSLLVHGGSLTRKALPALVARVERLALVDCTKVTGGFEHMAESPMSHLWIVGECGLGLRGLQPIAQARRLVALYLDGTAPGSLFRWLAPLTSLVSLDLSRPQGDPDVGRGLAALVRLQALEQLALRGAHVTDAVLHQLGALPALRRLDLSGGSCSASPRAWKKLRSLSELRLRDARGLHSALAGVEALKTLAVLDLGNHRLDPRQRALLAQALPDARILAAPAEVPAPPPFSPSSPSSSPTPVFVVPRYPVPDEPRAPARWPEDAPSLASLHVVIPDERGQSIGFDLRYDLRAIAVGFRAGDLVSGLGDAGVTTEQRAVALLLLPLALAHADPNADR